MKSILEENDFYAVRSYEFSNSESILLFELAVWHMPDIKKMIGPPIFSKKHSDEFLSKYNSAYLEENTWVAEKKREFLTPSDLLKNFLKKDINKLKDSGIPENIAVAIRSAKILDNDEFLKLVKKNRELSAFLREKYFTNLNLY
jgi:tRNA nucleotidyltransferase (CCA-adding enzyme)